MAPEVGWGVRRVCGSGRLTARTGGPSRPAPMVNKRNRGDEETPRRCQRGGVRSISSRNNPWIIRPPDREAGCDAARLRSIGTVTSNSGRGTYDGGGDDDDGGTTRGDRDDTHPRTSLSTSTNDGKGRRNEGNRRRQSTRRASERRYPRGVSPERKMTAGRFRPCPPTTSHARTMASSSPPSCPVRSSRCPLRPGRGIS